MSAQRVHAGPGGGLSGFSLFELLVVMLIIGLMSALVMPRMAATLPGVQLKTSARAVAASLRYARSKAVYESIPYIALFDNTQKRLAVEPIEEPIDVAELNRFMEILNGSKLQQIYEFPSGIEFSFLNHDDPDRFPILFFPRGDSTGGKIVVQNLRRKQYTITVDVISGRVEIDRL